MTKLTNFWGKNLDLGRQMKLLLTNKIFFAIMQIMHRWNIFFVDFCYCILHDISHRINSVRAFLTLCLHLFVNPFNGFRFRCLQTLGPHKYSFFCYHTEMNILVLGRIHMVHLWIRKYFMDDSSINFHDKFFLHFLLNFSKKWRKNLSWKFTDESSVKYLQIRKWTRWSRPK